MLAALRQVAIHNRASRLMRQWRLGADWPAGENQVTKAYMNVFRQEMNIGSCSSVQPRDELRIAPTDKYRRQ